MSGVVARLRSLFGVAAATGPALTTIKSWMNIFQTDVQTIKVATVDELAEVVRRGGYFCIGASHSYNGVQIVRDATATETRDNGKG